MTEKEKAEMMNLRRRVEAQREEIRGLQNDLGAARADIAALLWLNGNCQYCGFGRKDEYSGANRWRCGRPGGAANCRPEWRGPLWRKEEADGATGD